MMEKEKILYLSRKDVEEVNLSIKEVIKAVEEVFKQKGRGKVEVPPKPGIHPIEDSFIHAMPAYIPEMKAAGIKWVSGYPETGAPICIMDATWVTAKRTGAATAAAAKCLAKKESKNLG